MIVAPKDARDGLDRIVNQIIEDKKYISSLEPKIESLISKINGMVSKERSNENDTDLINMLKYNIKILTTINRELVRMAGELNKGFDYYNNIADKIDQLVAQSLKSDKNFDGQIKDNKAIER